MKRFQAIFGMSRPLVGRNAVIHHLPGETLHLFGCFAHMASIEWRMRVVFDNQLDRFGLLATCDFTGQPKRQVNSCRDTGGRNNFARAYDAFIGLRLRTHDPKYAHFVPVRRGERALQDSRRSQN